MGIFHRIKQFELKKAATSENIAEMKELQNRGAKIKSIQYTSPSGEKMHFSTIEELQDQVESDNGNMLDLDSIGDDPGMLGTVYDNDKSRNTDRCPNCGYQFDTPPSRGKKCPKCGEKFLVRHDTQLFNSELLRPEDAYASDCFDRMFFQGVTVDYARKIISIRTKKWHTPVAPRDLIWDIARFFPNTLKDDPIRMLETSEYLYYQLAIYEDACGRDPTSLLKSSVSANIAACKLHKVMEGSNDDYLYVCCNCCCNICNSRNGKKIRIKDAQEKMPIPFRDCQNKFSPKSKYHFCKARYIWYNSDYLNS